MSNVVERRTSKSRAGLAVATRVFGGWGEVFDKVFDKVGWRGALGVF